MNSRKYPQPYMLVGLLKGRIDLSILKDQLWYRIPIKTAPKVLLKSKYLSFYQPAIFEKEKWLIQYYGAIKEITEIRRKKLFPNEPRNPKSEDLYYKIELESLEKLSKPIFSKRGRRVIFIPTTFEKFRSAEELNDLFHESPLEDKLWNDFKKIGLDAERQLIITKMLIY